jgi:Spy/CpxP family protein refolding chaperone
MSPQSRSTVVLSLLGLSLALNAALAIGYFRDGVGWGNEDRAAVAAAGTVLESATDRAAGDYCLLDRLDLDDDQQARLDEMRRTMHEKRDAFRLRAGEIKSALADAICAGEDGRATLDEQLERYAANQAAMQRAVADHLSGVNAMLRPEQRETFRTLLRTEMFRGIRSAGDSARCSSHSNEAGAL